MNIKEIIDYGSNKLKENNVQDSSIKARILLQYIMQQNKSYFIVNTEKKVDKKDEKIYEQYIQEIINGKPLQYITNNQEFMGIDFYVDNNVLIPQPDTEVLVEETIKEIEEKYKDTNKSIQILDLCTGSGAIAISLAKYFENRNIKLEICASDISEKALEIAKKNANLNNVKITFILSNMFENINNKFDIIVSNPPYIESDVINTLSKEVQNEPHLALDGGKDGLDFYEIIAQNCGKFLKENGSILLEIGYDQKNKVIKLFQEKIKNVICIKDFAGNDRVIKGGV